MLRKILSTLLACIMMMVALPTTAYALTEETSTQPTIIETSNMVVAKQEVEDCTIQYQYVKETKENFLTIGNERYKLSVSYEDDSILVSMTGECEDLYETQVVAQASCTAIAVGLVTVAVIYASKDIIIAGMQEVLDVTNRAIEVQLNAIATTIDKVRSNKLTKSNVKATTKTKRKAATKAITTIKTAKKKNQDVYFAARLVGKGVYVSYNLSYNAAVKRLNTGYDVFASSAQAAAKVTKAASPKKRAEPHYAHINSEGYYPHFHPTGVKWKYNSNHAPHCWYATF